MTSYIDPVTGVFQNKLGIADEARLQRVENEITRYRIIELRARPIDGNFDLSHLSRIHTRLYQDLYEWAGKRRHDDLSRDGIGGEWKAHYAPAKEIRALNFDISKKLEATNNLRGLNRFEFVDHMSDLYAKFNYMHPFVKGNDRATQTLVHQLARQAGYDLNFHKVASAQWSAAAFLAVPQQHKETPAYMRPADTGSLKAAFDAITTAAPQMGLGHSRGRGR